MTKDDLSKQVSEKTGLTRKEVTAVLNSALEAITDELGRGGSVYLRGFGCFETKLGRPRRARNPQGEGVMVIPQRVRPVFRAYDDLKDAVHESLAPRTPVDFLFLDGRAATRVAVVGSFNSWDVSANPMERLPDGSWVAEVMIPSGQVIAYMFDVDGIRVSDPSAKKNEKGHSLRRV